MRVVDTMLTLINESFRVIWRDGFVLITVLPNKIPIASDIMSARYSGPKEPYNVAVYKRKVLACHVFSRPHINKYPPPFLDVR